MTVIDGTTHRLGRLASSIAKRLLKGEQIDVVNSEKVIIIGNREQIIKKYRVRQSLQHHGNPKGGPKFYKMPNMIVKSAVRGMLPSKTTTGRDALKRFKAHIGVPPLFDKSKKEKIAKAASQPNAKYTTVEELSKILGARW